MTPGSPTVRLAGIGDAEDLARLRYRWRAGERGEGGVDESAFATALAEWMTAHASTHVPFLAVRHHRAIGMAWLAVVDRVPGPGQMTRRSAYVQSTYVVPPERESGIGTLLLRCLLDHAQELGLDYVAVHPSERSFPFYRRLGFTDTDRVLELGR